MSKKDVHIVEDMRLYETAVIRTADNGGFAADVADRSVHRILLSIEGTLPTAPRTQTREAWKLLCLVLQTKAEMTRNRPHF